MAVVVVVFSVVVVFKVDEIVAVVVALAVVVVVFRVVVVFKVDVADFLGAFFSEVVITGVTPAVVGFEPVFRTVEVLDVSVAAFVAKLVILSVVVVGGAISPRF